jgi:hypothetical protein
MHNRNCLSIAPFIAALMVSATAFAQQPHAVELGVHYVYDRSTVTAVTSSQNGGDAEVSAGLTQHLAVVGEFSFVQTDSAQLRFFYVKPYYSLQQMTYTAGLRYHPGPNGARVQPFLEAEAGGGHDLGDLAPSKNIAGASSNAFAFLAGGGVAVRVGERLMLTPIRVDYLMTTFDNNQNNRQDHLRLAAGISVRIFGGRH